MEDIIEYYQDIIKEAKRSFPLEDLEEAETITQGQTCNLKWEGPIKGIQCRIWLCRCGIEDGMDFDNAITLEVCIGGCWREADVWEG